MSRRPFDPRELDQSLADADPAISELERYVSTSATEAPHGLSDRVMAEIEAEPAPRRGFLAWLLAPSAAGSRPGRLMRGGALAATLVLAVAGALFAGQLADLVRDVGGEPTPSPTQSVSPSPSTSEPGSPMASPSVLPSPAHTPGASDDDARGALPTAVPSPQATAEPTGDDSSEEPQTVRPSPTATASPSPTPTQDS